MRVVSKKEMNQIEQISIEEMGFSEELIIENVGIAGANFIEEVFLSNHQFGEVVVMVGPGNNGADGLAVARHLANRGFSVRAFQLFEECGGECCRQMNLARNFGVKVNEIKSTEALADYFAQTQDEYLVVDAILGLGIRFPLSNYLFDVVNIVNHHASAVVAIDVATGIDGDTGAVNGHAIEADVTLSIGLPKIGMYMGEGPKYSGEIVALDVGLPQVLLHGGDKFLLTPESILDDFVDRNKFAHKNVFGHCLVAGGRPGLTGAPIMAANAALRVGAGLVTASTWKECFIELTSRISPEIITGLIPYDRRESKKILTQVKRWDSIVVGPGLGRSEASRGVVLEILNTFAGPVVVDADGIRVLRLEEDAKVMATRKWPTILTPHVGEFADFMGVDSTAILDDPIGYVKKAVDKTQSTIILKGACTFIGFPNGETYINYYPNDGMASGGSGDVLAGILGGLTAQRAKGHDGRSLFSDLSDFYKAVRLGVVAHTLAGKHAVNKLGARAMTAGSIIDHLSHAFLDLEAKDQELLENTGE
jgi:NAD(P)H-hydrate epimerase